MSHLLKLLEQQKTLEKRIAEARLAEQKLAQQKVIAAAKKAGLFALPLEVLEREFLAIAERNKS